MIGTRKQWELFVKFKADCEPFKPYMFNQSIIANVTPSCWWKSLDGIVEKEFVAVAERFLTLWHQVQELSAYFQHLDIYTFQHKE